MALDIYWIGLLLLLPAVGILLGKGVFLRLYRHLARRRQRDGNDEAQPCRDVEDEKMHAEAKAFRRTFLQVYLVVMGADWLQVRETYQHPT